VTEKHEKMKRGLFILEQGFYQIMIVAMVTCSYYMHEPTNGLHLECTCNWIQNATTKYLPFVLLQLCNFR